MKKERAAQKERREATEKELFGVQTHIFMSHTVLIDLGFVLERKGFLLALGWHHTGCPGQFKWEGHSTMFPDLKEVWSLGKTDV